MKEREGEGTRRARRGRRESGREGAACAKALSEQEEMTDVSTGRVT